MNLLLDGPERKQLREILLEAFNRADLERGLLESSPKRELENLVTKGPFSDQVAELIDRAEREGWLDEILPLLEREVAGRTDLIGQVREIFEDAGKRADELGGTGPAPAVLRHRFVRFATFAAVLGVAAAVAGIVAWALSPEVGVWGLPGAAVALLAALAILILVMRPGRAPRTFMLGGAPTWTLVALASIGAVNGWILWASGKDARQPNFILQVAEKKKPVAHQNVHVRRAVVKGDDGRIDRVTNERGEAFFRLALGSDRVYLGGVDLVVGSDRRQCQFPAFSMSGAKRIAYDIADLGCVGGSPSVAARRSETASLRVASVAERAQGAEPPPLPLPPPAVALAPGDLRARKARSPLGLPAAPIVLDRLFYSLGYNPDIRAARWVAFTVDSQRTVRQPRRGRFQLDPDLPSEAQPDPGDFRRNPYDRGHLVSRLDTAWADKGEAWMRTAEEEINYYSVVVPQPMGTNQVTWLAVERFTTDLSARLGPIHVLAGPIFAGGQDSSTPFLVIGPGRTAVPVALFRVLLRQTAAKDWRAVAFIVPNDGSREDDPSVFVRSVADVEAATGLRLFPDLPANQARQLKGVADLERFAE